MNNLNRFLIVIAVLLIVILGGFALWTRQKNALLTNENTELKFRLGLADYRIRSYLRDPRDKGVFYYTDVNNLTNTEAPSIRRYGTKQDANFQKFGTVSLSSGGLEKLYSEALGENQEFRLVGFDGDRLVFTITGVQNSPGPCFSPWFYGNLYSISSRDLNQTAKAPYTVPSEVMRREKDREAACQKSL